MSMADLEKITDLWWTGVRLWYNEQDYLKAMQVWDQSVEEMELDCEMGDAIVPDDSDSSSTFSYMAPLLLFLAGCYLDAGDTHRARLLCRRCLSTTAFDDSLRGDNTEDPCDLHLARSSISEYVATFQEDGAVAEPWNVAHQIAAWAIERRKRHPSLLDTNPCWTDPFQRPGFFFPCLPSKAVYAREEHPDWCQRLEEHSAIVRGEYRKLVSGTTRLPQHWPQVGAGDHRDGAGRHDGSVVGPGGDWRELVLFGSGARPDVAPQTRRLLERLAPVAVDLAEAGAGEIILSVLGPHTHIAPHCASSNLRLTAHLGLQIPEDDGCYIQVAEEKLTWEEGRIIVFDDSFQHEVHNGTNQIRAILLLRFWHFNLQNRQQALQHILDAKETDRQQRCNPPLPPKGTRNLQGMNRQMCPTCGRSGFDTVRLVSTYDNGRFSCLCGREVL